jgi:nitrogen regulatory protein P-II 1
MKRIEVIVNPDRVSAVLASFAKGGYTGVMITEIQGHGKQKGLTQQWRGETYKMDFLPKTKLETIVSDVDTDMLVETITLTVRTGEIGDGKIFVSPVNDAIRIRTGEHGDSAIK